MKKVKSDFPFEFDTKEKIFRLIGMHIYYFDENNKAVYKMKICEITIRKDYYDNEIDMEMTCTPVSDYKCKMCNGDVVLACEDLNKNWFFSFYDADRKKRAYYANRQLRLF